MSQQLISRSPDLKRLRDEGYDIEIRSAYLLIKNVPHVNSSKEIKLGTLVSELALAGDATATPRDHVVYFAGDYPCNRDGSEIAQIRNQTVNQTLVKDLVATYSFSSKPPEGYKNYYDKMTTYIAIISSPAHSIDPKTTAATFPPIESSEDESIFHYFDTASSRAGIIVANKKLEVRKLAIVGVGGTGSYVLDLVAKTPVKEIHLFDGDRLSNHNAFRSPGAPSLSELRNGPQKATYFKQQYSKMHRNIISHDYYLDVSNVDQLREMDFVFLCLDANDAKMVIVESLEKFGTTFIDVGMGVDRVDNSLRGILRITTSTAKQRDHFRARVPLADTGTNDEYTRNIQIVELNALNAALAVIKWKKLCGFYIDYEDEYHCTYTIDGNMLLNEDRQCGQKSS